MLKWTLVLLAGALLGANVVYFLMTRDRAPPPAPLGIERMPTPPSVAADARESPPTSARPAAPATTRPATSPPAATTRQPTLRPGASTPGPAGLVVPVQGISARQLSNTYDDARGSGRVHEALDITAPRGTPVIAVADGHVEKLFYSEQGGLTLYQFEPGGRYVYYYAHLDRYAPGVVEGKPLRRGELIGYVGSTGNANAAAPHLHFAVFLLGPEKQWWKGTPVNPYPLLGGT